MSASTDSILSIDHDRIKSIMQNVRWNHKNAKAYNRYRLISCFSNWSKLINFELSQVGKENRILEVGAGTGFITEILASSGYKVTATDLSPAMLEQASQNLGSKGLLNRVTFIQSDAESLVLKSDTFSAVVSRWVLWTLPRPQLALSEMVRTLAPGGRLVLIDGQHMKAPRVFRWIASLSDFLLTGRRPGWKSRDYDEIFTSLPRMDAPGVANTLKDLWLDSVEWRRLSAREGDGILKNLLMGFSWKSYIVSGMKSCSEHR